MYRKLGISFEGSGSKITSNALRTFAILLLIAGFVAAIQLHAAGYYEKTIGTQTFDKFDPNYGIGAVACLVMAVFWCLVLFVIAGINDNLIDVRKLLIQQTQIPEEEDTVEKVEPRD